MTERTSHNKTAARDSWQIKEMPPGKVQLLFSRFFTPTEWDCLVVGFIPQTMEDKWFIFLEDNHLYFHRSWTGLAVYQLRLERDGERYFVSEAWVNADAWDKNGFNNDYHAGMLGFLINNLLLRKRTRFPSPAIFPRNLSDGGEQNRSYDQDAVKSDEEK